MAIITNRSRSDKVVSVKSKNYAGKDIVEQKAIPAGKSIDAELALTPVIEAWLKDGTLVSGKAPEQEKPSGQPKPADQSKK